MGKGQDGQCRICNTEAGEILKLGYCVICPVYMTYDKLQDKCVCQKGYSYSNGACQRKCSFNYVYSEQIDDCICLPGLIRVNSQCILCDSSNSARIP